MWHVNGDEPTMFVTEASARRYAALPVLIAAIREACENDEKCCGFCGYFQGHVDCPGIAALKAAGEKL